MTVVGDWTLYFDWGCTGTYYHIPMTFRSDGTYGNHIFGGTCVMKWVQVDGMILWQFIPPPEYPSLFVGTWTGNIAGNVMAGLMTNIDRNGVKKGCWYAIKAKTQMFSMRVREPKPEFDFTGTRLKTK